jgi:hypothetical protein
MRTAGEYARIRTMSASTHPRVSGPPYPPCGDEMEHEMCANEHGHQHWAGLHSVVQAEKSQIGVFPESRIERIRGESTAS